MLKKASGPDRGEWLLLCGLAIFLCIMLALQQTSPTALSDLVCEDGICINVQIEFAAACKINNNPNLVQVRLPKQDWFNTMKFDVGTQITSVSPVWIGSKCGQKYCIANVEYDPSIDTSKILPDCTYQYSFSSVLLFDARFSDRALATSNFTLDGDYYTLKLTSIQ